MGCLSKKPEDFALYTDNIRLAKLDEKEESIIQTRFPKFLQTGNIFGRKGRDLLGIPAIKSLLEADYEKYICENWALGMYTHLIQHFIKLSDRNLCLGLPILQIDEYSEIVKKIKMFCQENNDKYIYK